MNQIRFRRIEVDAVLSYEIDIDDRPLVETIRAYEQPFADAAGRSDIAGQYTTIPMQWSYSLQAHFLGDPAVVAEDDEKIALLICSVCGEVGCWPLLARIEVTSEAIVWNDFEQPHRHDWDYSRFGPFVFDRKQYEDALSEIDLPADSPVWKDWQRRWDERFGPRPPDFPSLRFPSSTA